MPQAAVSAGSAHTRGIVERLATPAIAAIVPRVDALIDERLANPDKSTHHGIWRDALARGAECVHELFEAGAAASTLLAGQTAVVDHVLKRLWHAEGDAFDELTLLAVGGYGRAELHPASDIDIAILVPRRDDPAIDERLAAWVTRLWDLGVDVGHSVRTVSECASEAASDITVITNLMEARLLCGDPSLFAEMRMVTASDRVWPPAEFLRAKLAEQEARHARFQTNAYRLEPNVKESLGGLRDFQTIAWVCQRQFERPGLEPLVTSRLLEPDELEVLEDGLELLWRTRYLLHRLSGRREDRLLFDYQREIATALGHHDPDGNDAIEAMMQRYYRTVMSLQRFAEILLQGIGGIISGAPEHAVVVPVGKRYQTRNGYLELAHENVFVHYPPALLEIFLVFGETPGVRGLRANTVRLIRKNLPLINDRFRSDPQAKSLFVSIFVHARKLTRTIRMMNGHGVMAAYLPAFNAIVGRMQYDLFHIYTVDEHTINVIRNLRRLTIAEHAEELPHCSEIALRLERPATLFLTALFHDIAKGRDGDHSILGAEDAARFAAAHGMTEHDAELMTWTVRQHLSMSMTAQRRDIDDPAVQLEFAQHVGTLERLDHLYLLTVSDIRATNPELWNSFKQSLLQSLHRHARLILERGLDNPLGDDAVIARRQSRTLATMDPVLANNPRRKSLWDSLGPGYFRQYQAAEIARHTEILLANGVNAGPLVALHPSPSRGATELLIYTPDDDALFALIATVLEALVLDVQSATIGTTEGGHALDTFHVLDNGGMVKGNARCEEIRHALRAALVAPKDIPSLVSRRPSRRLSHFEVSTNVTFSPAEGGMTELRITAADRPGILSSIARILLACGVTVHAARIATLGERIDDVFFVGMPDGGPVDDASTRARLTDALVERL